MARRALVIGTLVFLAVIIQTTVLSRLGLPGATPDLVVVSVVAVGLAMGPMAGAAAGFAAGALIDLSPPSDTPVGVNALVYLVIGFVVGFIVDPRDRTVWAALGIAGLSAAASVLAVAGLDALLGSSRVIWSDVPEVALTSALYAVLLAPLVIVPLLWLTARLFPPEFTAPTSASGVR